MLHASDHDTDAGAARDQRGWRGHGGPWTNDPRWTGEPPFRGPSASARLWFPVILSFLVQFPATLAIALNTGSFASWNGFAAVALALIGPAALIGARRFPGVVVAVVSLAAVAELLIPPSWGPPFLALAFAIVGGIVRGARIWVYTSVGTGWLVSVIVGSLAGFDWHPFRIALTTAAIAILMAMGEGIRSRRERMRERRRQQQEHRISVEQAERMRIARELHDVLAHSLSQIYVQAGVGLHLMESQPEKARESLSNIKSSSKTALDEVRGVLAFLRAETPEEAERMPEPDLSRLPALVDSMRSQGLEVTLDDRMESAPSAAVQLALYRIAQESLTNVLRHAQARSASVTLIETDGIAELTVRDDGAGSVRQPDDGGGRGLLGMTERAELLNGSLRAANADGGGFVVTARIPVVTA